MKKLFSFYVDAPLARKTLIAMGGMFAAWMVFTGMMVLIVTLAFGDSKSADKELVPAEKIQGGEPPAKPPATKQKTN